MPDPTRRSVSASQAPALFDASPYQTKWMLWHYLKGNEVEKQADGRMDWGQRMEPLLLEAAAQDMRLEVKRDQTYVRSGSLGATRDAQIIDPQRGPGSLETKVCFDYRQWMQRWSGGKAPPVDLEIQLQAQMMVGDGKKPFQWGTIAVWLAGEMHYFEREPVPELWESLKTRSIDLLNDVGLGHEPEPFGAPEESELLARLYPKVRHETLDLRQDSRAEELAEAAKMYTWACEQRSMFEKQAEQLKAKLLGVAKDHDEIALPHGVYVNLAKTPVKATVINRKAYVQQKVTVRHVETEGADESEPPVMGA